MILRPYGLVIDGRLEQGLELVMDEKRIVEIRPHSGIPENFVISPAFVNAHSHLEYRGLQGKIKSQAYWPWIMELVGLKKGESDVRVRQECIGAAHENKKTGVGLIAEHSDRPFAATALVSAGIGGAIFQETITVAEAHCRREKLASIRRKAQDQAKIWRKPVFLSPHALHTVDEDTIREFGTSNEPISIHAAESKLESQWTRDATGPIADFRRANGYDVLASGRSVVQTLADIGLLRSNAQLVHCCDVDAHDVSLIARSGASVAHCPRSNLQLNCPPAPIREMLDAGIKVGLGMDSPASSGQIDMFDEMRAALRVSKDRGQPLTAEEVWKMATSAKSIEFAMAGPLSWTIEPGSTVALIKINLSAASTVEDLIERGTPAKVTWC
jgi:cytosine/adenosine deaminase-related metal-dependent hydrolase